MTCEAIRPQLVGFQFGIVLGDERAAIEAHVIECKDCLRELLELKRAIETGEDGPRPSDVARARLRAAVVRVVRPAKRRWWERPVALAFAATAVIASMAAMHSLTSGPGDAPYAQRER